MEAVLPHIGGLGSITNLTPDLEKFKEKLDKFLSLVPDQPTVPGLTCPALSNSILDQIRHMATKPNE